MENISNIPLGPLADLGTKLIEYFRRKGEKSDAIETLDRGWVGERISKPLVAMHTALVKVETELKIYSNLLQTTSGNFRDILIKNLSGDFIDRAEGHLKEFWDNIEELEKTNPGGNEVMESVKGNACSSKERYSNELKQKIDSFLLINQMGGQPKSHDLLYVIDGIS